jgi:ketosteroid isomerase-like protein
MKRLSILLTMAALVVLTQNAAAQQNHAKPVANKPVNMPYKMENTDLRFGNSQYTLKVLQAWKAYEDNQLDNLTSMFTEDIWGSLPDGTVIKGREAFLNAFKAYRSSFASVTQMVNACTTLKSAEHPENDATLIWGVETDTKKDGTVQKAAIHEVWFFNKDGKVFEFHQYAAPILDEKK